MSAYVYIQYADVPEALISGSRQRIDSVTGAKLISLDGCPLTGQIEQCGDTLEIEYPFPRAVEIRESLVSWLMHWGICFRVVM